MSSESDVLDLLIVGGGPTGIACGLFARRNGLRSLLLEKGTLAQSIVNYPTAMRFFSTTDKLSLGNLPFISIESHPTRAEAIRYYQSVAEAEEVEVQLGVEAYSCSHNGDLFQVETSIGRFSARRVVLATGYFDFTNQLGVRGEDLPHVSHYYREGFSFFRKSVVVVGGRNSAIETALDLYRHGAHVTVVHRGESLGDRIKYWLRPDFDNRVSEGSISLHLNTIVEEISADEVLIMKLDTGDRASLKADALFAMTGYRPDARLFERFGIAYDRETLVPSHNEETFETNVSGLYLAGSVACGCKTWEIFIENGREHAERVVSQIAADLKE